MEGKVAPIITCALQIKFEIQENPAIEFVCSGLQVVNLVLKKEKRNVFFSLYTIKGTISLLFVWIKLLQV